MSRLDQIKDEYAFTRQYPTWDNFIANQPIFKQQEYYNETSKLYAAECCQASLEKASEKISLIENETSYVKQSEINIEQHIILL